MRRRLLQLIGILQSLRPQHVQEVPRNISQLHRVLQRILQKVDGQQLHHLRRWLSAEHHRQHLLSLHQQLQQMRGASMELLVLHRWILLLAQLLLRLSRESDRRHLRLIGRILHRHRWQMLQVLGQLHHLHHSPNKMHRLRCRILSEHYHAVLRTLLRCRERLVPHRHLLFQMRSNLQEMFNVIKLLF